jgi:hypothetical protein
MDKAALENRFNNIAQRMVYDTVTIGRGGNQAFFWLNDIKRMVVAGLVAFVL